MPVVWAEDEEADRRLIQTALHPEWSRRIRFARDGNEALAAVERRRPDLVVLDVNMPGLGGIETLRHLRSRNTTRDVPVVMFSTARNPADLAECRRLGIVDYVQKPIAFDDFARAVQQVLAFATAAATRRDVQVAGRRPAPS